MELKITITERKAGVIIINPLGPLNTSTYKSFESKVRETIKSDLNVLVFDLQSVDFICSAGIQVILDTFKSLDEQRKKVVLLNIQPQIMHIFEVLSITHLMEVCSSEKELDQCLAKIMEE